MWSPTYRISFPLMSSRSQMMSEDPAEAGAFNTQSSKTFEELERRSVLTSGVHGPVLEVARVRPDAKLPRVLRQRHISGTLSVAPPRARPRTEKLFLPCPPVSARSPRRRRAASWCPRRSGRRKSARSRSGEEPEEGLMPEFPLAK